MHRNVNMVQAHKNQAIMHKDTYIIISVKQRDDNLPTLIFPAMRLLLQRAANRRSKGRVLCLVKADARIQTDSIVR